MNSKIKIDRGNVQRFAEKDIDEILMEIKGDAYREYRNKFDLARREHIRTELPLQLAIELVSWCNLRCKMCYRSFRTDANVQTSMSLDMVDDIVNQAKDMGVSAIQLGAYTEATLHPEILTVIRKFSESGAIDIWFRTNGIEFSEEIAELITDIPLTKINISIDAATKETYQKIRGGGRYGYDRVLKNIDRFLEIRNRKKSQLPFLLVSFVEQDDNRSEMDMFYEIWRNKADTVDVQTLIDIPAVVNINSSNITEKDYGNFDCTNPYHTLLIKYDGQILPCCSVLYETDFLPPVYLKDYSLREYWNNPKLLEFVQMINEKNYSDDCKKCIASIKI